MKIVRIFQTGYGQICICIGLPNSSDLVILVSYNVTPNGFFILDERWNVEIFKLMKYFEISEIKIPVDVLKNLMNIIKDMKNKGIKSPKELNEEIKKLEGWFHIGELAIS